MISPDQVAAVLVTRGDVDLTPILQTLPYGEVVVWDNSKRQDLGIYGRYAAIAETTKPVIYTQDDDLLVTCHQQLLADYEPLRLLVNYPEPWDIPWVARGALFDRHLPFVAFNRYKEAFPIDDDFRRYICDGIFALLTSRVHVVDYGSIDLPVAFEPGRISTSPGWYDGKRPLIQQRCQTILA